MAQEDFAAILAVPIKCSGGSVLMGRQTARKGWMDGQVWIGMALRMDLYGTKVEIAEPSETLGWMGHLRKVRVEMDVPHQAEGSKHTHYGDFLQPADSG